MHIILGPPGTGKTTKLLALVESYLDRGISPDRIGYFSFTRQAAQEAVQRACRRFRLAPTDLPHFRTLHSFALSRLGIRKQKVMNQQHYQDAASVLKVGHFTTRTPLEDGPYQDYGLGDGYLEIINMARTTRLPLREVYNMYRPDLPYSMVDYVDRGLREFKKAYELYDFTDMLELFVHQDLSPNFDVVFIDEAQDLSPLQWEMVNQIESRTKEMFIAGDDDQAIYRWAGADVDYFIRLGGTHEVLGQSYRIPSSHHALSQRIISQIHHRRIKEFLPRDDRGLIRWHRESDSVNIDSGDWLLMSRTRKGTKLLEREVRQRGMFYHYKNSREVDQTTLQSIQLWEQLRNGGALQPKDVRLIYKRMLLNEQVKRGHKTLPDIPEEVYLTMNDLLTDHGLLTTAPWDEALGAVPDEEARYYKACIRRGEDFRKPPRIRISTIHGAKGAEATNVLLMTDCPARPSTTGYGAVHMADDELRVLYVGLTRAKQELHLVHPTSSSGYKLA